MSSDSDDSELGIINNETLKELQLCRAELEEEINFLTKTLKEIDNRVNDLTFEQLILRGMIMKREKNDTDFDECSSDGEWNSADEGTEQKLNLEVPVVVKQYFEEDD